MPTTFPTTPKSILPARIFYILIWLLVAAYALLSELDVLPVGFVRSDPETVYALSMLCVLLTLSTTWGAVRFFSFKTIKEKAHRYAQTLPLWNTLRIALLAIAIFFNLVTYYALLSGTSALYCLGITLIALLFCWPKRVL